VDLQEKGKNTSIVRMADLLAQDELREYVVSRCDSYHKVPRRFSNKTVLADLFAHAYFERELSVTRDKEKIGTVAVVLTVESEYAETLRRTPPLQVSAAASNRKEGICLKKRLILSCAQA
jgi:hypothetical protein